MRTLTLEQFHAELKAQGVPRREDIALVCPRCKTVQSAMSLIHAGAGAAFEDVEKFLGFYCVGRFTNDGPARKKPDGLPCDWTLGGLFKLHELEVITPDGMHHPRFEVATPEDAIRLARINAVDTATD